jgi:peroxiredoxin Q/BCP
MPITIGKPAPAFTLVADDGRTISLKDLKGRPVILYFYPRDDTPTCTKEACAFRDDFPRFELLNGVILGVSPDTPASHAKFRAKYKLPFTLLSDPDHAVAERYGVWGKKKLFGVSYTGIVRTTFVIDGAGMLRGVFRVTSVAGHAAEVAQAIAALA